MKGDVKPLIPLLGVPLIERVILTAKKSGLNDFYIVTGYHDAQIRTHLEIFGKKRGINITIIQNDEWEKGNGLSALIAKDYVYENFILLMCDHIYDESILKKLKNEKITGKEVILVVDYNIDNNNQVDSVDATKVLVNNNREIMNIGKKIPHYNAFDTGIFLCSPSIFKALEESRSKGDTSLSGGIQVMSKKGLVKTIDIGDAYWVDIDNERMLKKAEKMLLTSLRKQSDGPIMRFVNRPISTRITRYLYKSSLTPNQISLISLLFAIFGACFFLLGGYINLVFGAFLAQTSSVIDGIDGEIARLKFQETKFGIWFDAVLDRYSDAFLLFSLTIYVYLHLPQINVIFVTLIGFFAIIGTFMNSYTAVKFEDFDKLRGKDFPIGRDVRLFLIFLTCLFNQPFLALLFIALATNGENMRRIVVLKNQTTSSYKSAFLSLKTKKTSLKDKRIVITHSSLKKDLYSSE
jgi:CDP-L-myo-inositol myo-inositolphosphotransferase